MHRKEAIYSHISATAVQPNYCNWVVLPVQQAGAFALISRMLPAEVNSGVIVFNVTDERGGADPIGWAEVLPRDA